MDRTADLVAELTAVITESYEAPGPSPSALDHVYAAEAVTGITAHEMVTDELADTVYEKLQDGAELAEIAAYLVGILTEA